MPIVHYIASLQKRANSLTASHYVVILIEVVFPHLGSYHNIVKICMVSLITKIIFIILTLLMPNPSQVSDNGVGSELREVEEQLAADGVRTPSDMTNCKIEFVVS